MSQSFEKLIEKIYSKKTSKFFGDFKIYSKDFLETRINGHKLKECGFIALCAIKRDADFPFLTGRLKFRALKQVKFNKIIYDKRVSPYIDYLEYGTGEPVGHSSWRIYNAFGRGYDYFVVNHGQSKHIGFIERQVDLATKALAKAYGGEIVS